MKIKKLLKDAYEIIPEIRGDERGIFVKTFNADIFRENRLETAFAEEYYSVSHKNVLRGMHFQLPPYEHVKMVYCVFGKVLDVAVDIRSSSPDFGKSVSVELDAEKANMVYLPKGFAHGFYVLGDKAIMMYRTSTVYNPKYDSGIIWNSINFKWPCKKPILSARDSKFESFESFITKKVF
ncbi:MAG: dTDP-4-dehydrorhamnose 3,5-epimerase [Elusimicrobiota bacterium]